MNMATPIRHINVMLLAGLFVGLGLGCSAEVTTPPGSGGAGGGGEGEGGHGGQIGEGGAGGAAPGGCSALAVAGAPVVLDEQLGGLRGVNVTSTREGELFMGYPSVIDGRFDSFVTLWLEDGWDTWPPSQWERNDFEELSLMRSAAARNEGVEILGGGFPAVLYQDVTSTLGTGTIIQESSYPHTLAVSESGTLLVVNEGVGSAEDFRFRIVMLDVERNVPWVRDEIGCGASSSDVDKFADPSVLLSEGDGPDLIALGDVPDGASCPALGIGDPGHQSRLLVLPLDADGNGEPIVLEERADAPLSSMTIVRREEGPLLVFARHLPTFQREVYAIPLDWNGQPTGPVKSLGLPHRERMSVVEVEGGFIVAHIPMSDGVGGTVAAALFDLEANLLQVLESEAFSYRPKYEISAASSPDGRSVMFGWVQRQDAPEAPNYGLPTILRYDCVAP